MDGELIERQIHRGYPATLRQLSKIVYTISYGDREHKFESTKPLTEISQPYLEVLDLQYALEMDLICSYSDISFQLILPKIKDLNNIKLVKLGKDRLCVQFKFRKTIFLISEVKSGEACVELAYYDSSAKDYLNLSELYFIVGLTNVSILNWLKNELDTFHL